VPLLLVDLDNTLVDRYAAFERWACEFVEQLGVPPEDVDWLIIGDADGYKPRERFAEEIAERFRLIGPAASAVVQHLRDGMVDQLEIDQEVMPALAKATQSGWTPVAVTNGTLRRQERKIHHVGLDCYLTDWVISEAVGVAKPDPKIFQIAAARLGTTLDGAWMIGDSAHADVGGAHSVGLPSVWLHRGRPWTERDFAPTRIADTCAEAIEWVLAAANWVRPDTNRWRCTLGYPAFCIVAQRPWRTLRMWQA